MHASIGVACRLEQSHSCGVGARRRRLLLRAVPCAPAQHAPADAPPCHPPSVSFARRPKVVPGGGRPRRVVPMGAPLRRVRRPPPGDLLWDGRHLRGLLRHHVQGAARAIASSTHPRPPPKRTHAHDACRAPPCVLRLRPLHLPCPDMRCGSAVRRRCACGGR